MTGIATANEMMFFQMSNGHKYKVESLMTYVVGGTAIRLESQKAINANLLRGRIRTKKVYGSSEQGIIALLTSGTWIRIISKTDLLGDPKLV